MNDFNNDLLKTDENQHVNLAFSSSFNLSQAQQEFCFKITSVTLIDNIYVNNFDEN